MKRRSLLSLLAAALVLIPGTSAANEPTFLESAQEGALSSSSIFGLANVLDMLDLRSYVARDEFRAAMAEIAHAPDVDPDVRAIAAYELQRAAARAGDVELVEEMETEQGFLTAWRVIGPFANDGMSGFREPTGVETDGVELDAVYPGRYSDIAWRDATDLAETGYLDLTEMVRPYVTSVSYVALDFELDEPLVGYLSLAVDGAYRVWIDGEPLGEQPDHLGGFVLRDRVPVDLESGSHQLLIKIGVDDHIVGLHARLLDETGHPVVVAHRAADTAGVVAMAPEGPWPSVTTMLDRVSQAYDAAPSAQSAAAAVVVLASMMPSSPDEPWLPYLDLAMEGDVSADAYRWVAGGMTEHWRKVEWIERGVQAHDDRRLDYFAASLLLVEMGEDSRLRGRQLIEELLSGPEPFLAASLTQLREVRSYLLYYSSYTQLLALAEDHPDTPALLDALIVAAEQMNQRDRLPALYSEALAHNRLGVGTLATWVWVMRESGGEDAIPAALEVARGVMPGSLDLYELQAELAVASDDWDAAIAAMDTAITQCPGAAYLYESRGRYRLESGDRDGAIADFELALVHEPQNAELRNYVTALGVEGDTFYEEFRIGDERLVELAGTEEPPEEVEFTYLVDQKVIHVYPNGLATTYVQQAYAIHTDNGADQLRSTAMGYSPDSEIVEVIAVRVIEPDGRVRQSYASEDYAPYGGPSSIYYDVRTRSLFFPNLRAGEILSIEYTVADVSYRNIFDDYFGDVWFVQAYQPKEYARYGIIAPTSRTLYRNDGGEEFGSWTESMDGDEQRWFYEATDVPRVERESGSPGFSELADYISVSTYDSWDALAEWYWNLIEDQLVVSPDIERTVAELTDGLTDDREIVAAIYGYVVRNTRYVGLEFGIHGFKPYRTSDCFNRRFGDCKDTASLMKVMLGVAGIEAHIVLTRTRDLGRIDAYPPSLAVFNHAITYVPQFDLFLDGTAGFSGSGETPSMDQGASAVIVRDGEGGDFTTIGILPAEENQSITRIAVDLSGDTPVGTGVLSLTGAFAPANRRAYEAAEQRVERFGQFMSRQVPGTTVTAATFNDLTDIEASVDIEFAFEGGEWVRSQGDTLQVLPLGSEPDLAATLAGSSEREQPLTFDTPFVVDEVYTYTLPDGYEPASIPEPVEIQSDFGEARMEIVWEDGTLECTFWFALRVDRIEPGQYPSFREWVTSVQQAAAGILRFNPGGGA